MEKLGGGRMRGFLQIGELYRNKEIRSLEMGGR